MTLRDWARAETPKPVIAVLEQTQGQLLRRADFETTQNHFTDFFLGTPIQVPDPVYAEGEGWVLEFPDGEFQDTLLRLKPVYHGIHSTMEARISSI